MRVSTDSSVSDSSCSRRDEKERPRDYMAIAPRPPGGSLKLPELRPRHLDAEVLVELVIGFGRGRFILERGALPGLWLIGVEIKAKLAVQVAQKTRSRNLQNVTIWQGDARDVLQRIEGGLNLHRVYINFPDPWWKKRHAKRQLINAEFIDLLSRRLASGGELFIQTDVEERAEAHRALLEQHSGFKVEPTWLGTNPYGSASNREARAELDGLPIWRLRATCRSQPQSQSPSTTAPASQPQHQSR